MAHTHTAVTEVVRIIKHVSTILSPSSLMDMFGLRVTVSRHGRGTLTWNSRHALVVSADSLSHALSAFDFNTFNLAQQVLSASSAVAHFKGRAELIILNELIEIIESRPVGLVEGELRPVSIHRSKRRAQLLRVRANGRGKVS